MFTGSLGLHRALRERMVALIPDRNDTYRKFGPILLEAQTLVLLKHINLLRKEQGMPEITEQDLIDSLNNHLSELEPYDWMNENSRKETPQ